MQLQESYKIDKAPTWAESLTDEQIKNLIVDTDFAQEQIEEGRDFCYFLNKYNYINDFSKADYSLMAYTLTQPENLERASAYDMILEENETFEIHRISVLRDGILIDKLPDTSVKVLDNESQSNGGVLVKSKKINISIKDLHLYDVLIMEDTRLKVFTEKEFVRRDFVKHTYITPDTYWAYGKYIYKFINDRNQTVAYKKFFFRDENRNLIEDKVQYLQKGETFEFNETNYINGVDAGREIYPFIDFATESTWKDLSNYLYPFYKEVFAQSNLKSFAPDLVQKIDTFATIDEKMQYAIEFVQNNIYYTYNSDEMNGHKPQEPSVTFQNKQGDCKAKCTLLKVILDYIGVDSSIVLVNYNADFYLKYYLPSLLSFNHVIVKITHNEEDYFVDATSRNEFGRLEKRSVLSFCHFMEINENQELSVRKATYFKDFCLNENVKMEVQNGVGKITLYSTYQYNRANNVRSYFKNTNKKEIIDGYNRFLYYNLNYVNDRNEQDIRNIFKDARIQVVKDDKIENEVTIQYEATIENPYFTDKQGKRFLMYFDHNILKKDLIDFHHKDSSFWHSYDSERYEIELIADQNIDTKEKYTIQQLDIVNDFFSYSSKKDIKKNSGKVIIEYNPLTNKEITLNDIPFLREEYYRITDSNFGLGIDVIEKGFFNSLKRLFS
ncbi:MAG: hypothetical protein Q3983_09385 [Capnocytophaga sp.]|nr:hypothetical protein [Capnocytophaga sp.]